MLAIKLGLGDRVEELITAGTLFRYNNLHLGVSLIDHDVATGEDVVEAIAMLSIGVTVPEEYADMFIDTAALERLTWVDEAHFLSGLRNRNVRDFLGNQLSPVDEIDVCVHGLCLDTTALAITSTQ